MTMAGTDGSTGLPAEASPTPERYRETLRIAMTLRQAIAAGSPDPIRAATGKLFNFVLDNFDGSRVTFADLTPYLPPNTCRQVLVEGGLQRVKEGVVPVAVMREVIGNFKVSADRLDGPAMDRLALVYYDRIMEAVGVNKRAYTIETLLELAMRKPDPYLAETDDCT